MSITSFGLNSPAKLMLTKEFSQLKKAPVSIDYYIHDFQNENIFEWIVYLFGPSGTCFEGGSFMALMRFPPDYPHSPPSLQILSQIIHPNIFKDGKVCISTLQVPHPDASLEESKLNWSAVLGVSGALQSVVSLLADPNPDDPAHPEAAQLFIHNRAKFNQKAGESSRKSASDLPRDFVKPMMISLHESKARDAQDAYTMQHWKATDDDIYSYDTDDEIMEMDEEDNAEGVE